MKFRHWRRSYLGLNFSRLGNSFEFPLNRGKETQNNLHAHFKMTITFFCANGDLKNVKARLWWRAALLALIMRDIIVYFDHSLLRQFLIRGAKFERFSFCLSADMHWINQLWPEACSLFFITTDATKQPTYEEDEWWENDKDGRVKTNR